MNASVSIIIPAYNEEKRLAWALPQVWDYLKKNDYGFEIIIVSDGSTDRTVEVARDFSAEKKTDQIKILELKPNRGKGAAVKAGMLKAQGKYVLFTDADQATPIENLPRFLEIVKSGKADIAIASRSVRSSKLAHHQRFTREWAGKMFASLRSLLTVSGIHDTQCGFKLFKKSDAQKLFGGQKLNSEIFDVEILVAAVQANLKIAEVGVTWNHDADSRITYNFSKMLRVYKELFRIRQLYHLKRPVRAKVVVL